MDRPEEIAPAVDFSNVLVVAKSPINRIVVAKIVQQAGLRPVMEAPETAAHAPGGFNACVVILDGGPNNADCDGLLSHIAALRRVTGRALPAVILLSNRVGTTTSLGLSEIIDEVVAKPLTPEKLQPVIERLIALARE